MKKNRTLAKKSLKPCPFCGDSKYTRLDTDGLSTWVICCNCSAVGPRIMNGPGAAETAMEEWNDRASGWIPITEQKPTTAEHVLVTLYWDEDDYEVTELDYGVDVACGGRFAKYVTAWMPLPEPYKEEKHD